MANKRMIYRNITTCEQLADCSMLARLLYTWGIPHSSDYGVLAGSPRSLKGAIFPMADDVTAKQITAATAELVTCGLWQGFEVNGSPYVCYPTFDKFQETRYRTGNPRDGLPIPASYSVSPRIPRSPGESLEVPENSRSVEVSRGEVSGEESTSKTKASAPPAETRAVTDFALASPPTPKKPTKPEKVDTPQQAIIQRAWTAFGNDGKPLSKGYSALTKILSAKGLAVFTKWVEHIEQTAPEVDRSAAPMDYLADHARTAMSQPWTWDGNRDAKRTNGKLWRCCKDGSIEYEDTMEPQQKASIRRAIASGEWDVNLGYGTDDPRHPNCSEAIRHLHRQGLA